MLLGMLVLHISALVLWSATLLYLPLLATGSLARGAQRELIFSSWMTLERFVFTHLASPLALIAILSGTFLFILKRTTDGWLFAKLTVVVGLVVCHALVGWLILRMEQANGKTSSGRLLPFWGRALGVISVILITTIVWLVLAKPALF